MRNPAEPDKGNVDVGVADRWPAHDEWCPGQRRPLASVPSQLPNVLTHFTVFDELNALSSSTHGHKYEHRCDVGDSIAQNTWGVSNLESFRIGRLDVNVVYSQH